MQNLSYSVFDLNLARRVPDEKHPMQHQIEALNQLRKWSEEYAGREAGAIMVLPTAGGKTYTATHFICTNLIPKQYKVIWLAHKHDLLDQAKAAFKENADKIVEPKPTLNVRVVSGAKLQGEVSEIKATDDVLIVTLQTLANAFRHGDTALNRFLTAAGEKLCVVFDEAHHAPAPSYANVLLRLRSQHPKMLLLGLTATPTHMDEKKRGWLIRLFPQRVIYSISRSDLMSRGILSRPIEETIPTHIEPTFDNREYQKWVNTFKELPESIVEQLANKGERNELIANTYAINREKFGKTIIFADRWFQCDAICELLKRREIRAGVIYSKIDAHAATANERNRSREDENHAVLEQFRRNELDVLVNVNMLTEGTDVPSVKTIFITRQIKSQIRLTQMVGRALRGPAIGGTKDAYIVTFEDDWTNKPIDWADITELAEGGVEDSKKYGLRPPVHLISIELVQQLARLMDTGSNTADREFVSMLPVGWYKVEFQTLIEDSEDTEPVSQLIMVFDTEADCFSNLLAYLAPQELDRFASESVVLNDVGVEIEDISKRFFPADTRTTPTELRKQIFLIARHMAQNDNSKPQYFPYEARELNDLDAVAKENLDKSALALDPILNAEYARTDRFWNTWYPKYSQFKSQYDASVNRLIAKLRNSDPTQDGAPAVAEVSIETYTEERDLFEPSDEIKRQVKAIDNFACACCGDSRSLHIDHIVSRYDGGPNSIENLQTLCGKCNRAKGTATLSFRIHKNPSLLVPPAAFPSFSLPRQDKIKDPYEWSLVVRRHFNFFYGADATNQVFISARGTNFYEWEIELWEANDPAWIKPFLGDFVQRIQEARHAAGLRALEGIRVTSPGLPPATFFSEHTPDEASKNLLQHIPNGTQCVFKYAGKMYEGRIVRGEFVVPRFGKFSSFTAASLAITGTNRNGWNDWELLLPDSLDWIAASEWRKSKSNE